jgi:predicted RNA-binding Zn ribbon-like protein
MRPTDLRLLGGDLALDFVNTVEPRADTGTDVLRTFDDLLEWAAHAGAWAGSSPSLGPRPDEAILRARELRELLHRVFTARATGTSAPAGDLRQLTAWWAELVALADLELPRGEPARLSWERGRDRRCPLGPVVAAAMRLLADGDPRRLKVCASAPEECGWLFYDSSKAGRRRWCSMDTCGSREKNRRRSYEI